MTNEQVKEIKDKIVSEVGCLALLVMLFFFITIIVVNVNHHEIKDKLDKLQQQCAPR